MVNVDADIYWRVLSMPMALVSGIVFVFTSFSQGMVPFAAMREVSGWSSSAFTLALMTLSVSSAAREIFTRLYGVRTGVGQGPATSMMPSCAQPRRQPAQQ